MYIYIYMYAYTDTHMHAHIYTLFIYTFRYINAASGKICNPNQHLLSNTKNALSLLFEPTNNHNIRVQFPSRGNRMICRHCGKSWTPHKLVVQLQDEPKWQSTVEVAHLLCMVSMTVGRQDLLWIFQEVKYAFLNVLGWIPPGNI